MRKFSWLLLFATTAMAQVSPPSNQSRVAGRFVAYNYGQWTLPIYRIPSGTGSQTFTLSNSTVQLGDGRVIMPFNTNAQVNVGTETVTLTAVGAGCIANSTITGGCSLTATFAQSHTNSDRISPATFGLQEALNDAGASGGGAVTVDSAWTAMGGTTAMVNAATKPANTGVEDARTGAPGGGGSGTWSALTAPTANLTLIMASYQTAFTHTNPFTPQSSFTSAFSMAGSGLNFGTEYNTMYSAYMPNAYPSDEFDVGIKVPNTSTAFQSSALSGYANCAQPSGLHYCIGVYGQAIMAANGAETSAINGNASDNNFAGLLLPGEFNSQVQNVGTTGATMIVTANVSHAGTAYDGIDIGGYGSIGHYRYGLSSVDPLTAPALIPNVVYSAAGTALPSCSSGSYNGAELPVSDLSTTTAGAIYAGSGTVSGIVACGKNTSGLYDWYVAAAATFAGAGFQMQDTFTGTVGTHLDAHTADTGQTWTQQNSIAWAGPLTLNGSNSIVELASLGLYSASLVPSSADYTVSAPITLPTGAGAGGWGTVLGRMNAMSSSSFQGYSCRFTKGTGVLLEKWVSAANTQIGTTDTSVTADTHTIAIKLNSTTLTCYIDGVASASATGTDATYSAAGSVGLALNATGSPYSVNQSFTVQ